MALPGDLAFKVKFDRTNSPPNFEIEDATDYTTLGIALADVRGNFANVLDPLGNVIHNNIDFTAPDIVASSSLLFTGLDIPLDVDGKIIAGQYSFTYNIKTDNPITVVNQGLKQFTISGDQAALITTAASIIIVRSTGNNGTYTVVTAVFGGVNTVITVSEAIPSGTADGSIQFSTQTTFTKTSTVTYADTVPVVAINVIVDCFCGNLTSQDKTDYTDTTIITRVHTVKYPAALNRADVVSSGASILVTPIFTKTWTTVIETTLTVDLGSGNTIQAIITGSKDTKVECDLSLCDISCCLLALDSRYKDNRTNNPSEAVRNFRDLTRMIQLISEFRIFSECDQHDAASAAVSEIKTLGNCTDACTCSGDEPNQIVPLCNGAGNTIQVIAGTGIVVTTTFQNNNYVYQIAFSASMLAIINSVKPQNVVGGTGITVVETLEAGVQTWTVTNDSPFTAENRMEFLVRLQYTGPTAVTITPSNYLVSGANMNATATVVSTTIAGAGNNNNFRVSAFQVANNNNYKVTMELVIVTRHGSAYTLNSSKPFNVEIINKISGQFDFRFVDVNGATVTNTAMFVTTDLFVNIKISQ